MTLICLHVVSVSCTDSTNAVQNCFEDDYNRHHLSLRQAFTEVLPATDVRPTSDVWLPSAVRPATDVRPMWCLTPFCRQATDLAVILKAPVARATLCVQTGLYPLHTLRPLTTDSQKYHPFHTTYRCMYACIVKMLKPDPLTAWLSYWTIN